MLSICSIKKKILNIYILFNFTHLLIYQKSFKIVYNKKIFKDFYIYFT